MFINVVLFLLSNKEVIVMRIIQFVLILVLVLFSFNFVYSEPSVKILTGSSASCSSITYPSCDSGWTRASTFISSTRGGCCGYCIPFSLCVKDNTLSEVQIKQNGDTPCQSSYSPPCDFGWEPSSYFTSAYSGGCCGNCIQSTLCVKPTNKIKYNITLGATCPLGWEYSSSFSVHTVGTYSLCYINLDLDNDGYTPNDGDCDDDKSNDPLSVSCPNTKSQCTAYTGECAICRYPNAPEFCDNVDTDCDGVNDEYNILGKISNDILCTYDRFSDNPNYNDKFHKISSGSALSMQSPNDLKNKFSVINIYANECSTPGNCVSKYYNYFSDNISNTFKWYNCDAVNRQKEGCCPLSYCYFENEKKCMPSVSEKTLNNKFPFSNPDDFADISYKGDITTGVDVCVLKENDDRAEWLSLYPKQSQYSDHSGYCNNISQCYYYDDNLQKGRCINHLEAPSAVEDLVCADGLWSSKTVLLYSFYDKIVLDKTKTANILDYPFGYTCNYNYDVSECISYSSKYANYIYYSILDHNNYDPNYFLSNRFGFVDVSCSPYDPGFVVKQPVYKCNAKTICGLLCKKDIDFTILHFKFDNYSIYEFKKNLPTYEEHFTNYLSGLASFLHYKPNYYVATEYFNKTGSYLDLSRMDNLYINSFVKDINPILVNFGVSDLDSAYPVIIKGNSFVIDLFKKNVMGISMSESIENKNLNEYDSGYFNFKNCIFYDNYNVSRYPLFSEIFNNKLEAQFHPGYEKEFGCCHNDDCWTGTTCITGFNVNEGLTFNDRTKEKFRFKGYFDTNYICVKNNAWKESYLKYNWDSTSKGYCFDNSDCWVREGFDCIDSGEFYGDAYCLDGNLVSRLSFVAKSLLNSSDLNLNNYILYCDSFDKSLNDGRIGFRNIDNKVSGVCVLDDKTNSKTIFGFNINKNVDVNDVIESIKAENNIDVPYSNLNDIDDCSNIPDDGEYHPCGKNNRFWFNNKTNSIIVTRSSFTFTTTNILSRFFNWLFGNFVSSESVETKFLHDYGATATKLYIQKTPSNGNLFSAVSYYDGVLVSESNFFDLDSDVCDLIDGVTKNCFYDSTNKIHKFDFNQSGYQNYWTYLSSKVNLIEGNNYEWLTCGLLNSQVNDYGDCCDDLVAYRALPNDPLKCYIDSDGDLLPDQFDSCVDVAQGTKGCGGCPDECVKLNPCQYQILSCASGKPICVDQTSNCVCQDSDGGENINVKGVLTNDNLRLEDYCEGNILHEYACILSDVLDDPASYDNIYTCPNGCANGKCNS